MDKEQAREQAEAVAAFHHLLTRSGISSQHATELTQFWMDLHWSKPYYSHSLMTTDSGYAFVPGFVGESETTVTTEIEVGQPE